MDKAIKEIANTIIFKSVLIMLIFLLTSCVRVDANEVSVDKTSHKIISHLEDKENVLFNALFSQYNTTYTITSNKFEQEDIVVFFPQISMPNKEMQEKINELILSELYEMFGRLLELEESIVLEVDFEVKFSSDRLLSVVYSGLSIASRPRWVFYSTNIDIKTGEVINLNDIVEINEDFMELLLNESTLKLRYDLRDIENKIANEVRETISNPWFINWLQNSERPTFYFTTYKLGFSVGLPHVIGGHVELEILYELLSSR